MASGNPVLSKARFGDHVGSGMMTVGGTAAKALGLLVVLIAAAAFTWHQTATAVQTAQVVTVTGQIRQVAAVPSAVYTYLMVGVIGGLVLALVTIFQPRIAAFTSPFYAAMEGMVLGALSALSNRAYPGVAMEAVVLTFSIFAIMLFTYLLGLVRATENFKRIVIVATGGIALYYAAALLIGLFGVRMPLIWDTGWLGIGFSIFVVILASMNLVIDFNFIEEGVAGGAAKYMEWYAAFGLLVTLVWLYLEILRLLSKVKQK